MYGTIPWIQKYRPNKINDIILDDDMRKYVKSFIKTKDKQKNLIFTGDPGVGKTTVAKCIVDEILGPDVDTLCREFNSSGEKGVKAMTLSLKQFCSKDGGRIVILDEADNISEKHQADIVGVMKSFESCRFIFICNDIKKIIEDIQSVSSIIRFQALSNDQIYKYLQAICSIEDIPYSKDGLDMITYVSQGDMRKAINELQKTAFTFKKIMKSTVLAMCNIPDPIKIKAIVDACLNKDHNALTLLEELLDEGYYMLELCDGFINVLIDHDLPEDTRIGMIDKIYETKAIMTSGTKSKLQLYAMVAKLIE